MAIKPVLADGIDWKKDKNLASEVLLEHVIIVEAHTKKGKLDDYLVYRDQRVTEYKHLYW